MRSLAIAFVLAFAALAVTPQTAAVPPVCLERNVQEGPLTAHVGQCDPQYAEVDFCPSWGSPERHIHQDIVDPRVGYVDVEWCTPHSPPVSAPANDPGPCGVSQQRCPAPHFPDPRDLLPTDIPYCITVDCDPVAAPQTPSDCEKQDMTPTTVAGYGIVNPRDLVWGAHDPQECDVDVEPVGACAPASGHTTERHILFLHVTLLVCDGGVDPPILS